MITFYDIASALPEKAWSPNTFKTRISLNYKGIPYRTEWVEYTGIESTVTKIGGSPTQKVDGRNFYTLPTIRDEETGKVISDSAVIAEYLDEKYPDRPLLYPPGSRAAIATLEDVFMKTIYQLVPTGVLETYKFITPASQAHFRAVREKMFGKKLEELAAPGPARDARLEALKENLEKIAGFYDKNGQDKLFFFGDTFSFADAIVIGFLLWIKLALGADGDEWKAVASWSNGRWGRLIESTKALQKVD